jgi:hypothetical protein
MRARQNPILPSANDARLVHFQAFYGSPTSRSFSTNKQSTFRPLKMLNPLLRTWVKQGYNVISDVISSRSRCALAQVAVWTGETKIVAAITGLRVNMLNVHLLAGVNIASTAILTTACGASVHQTAERGLR